MCCIFVEITHRFQTARPPVRQNLLQYLLPWLYNMELVDPHMPPSNPLSHFITRMQEFYPNESCKPPFRKDGWGSAEATEMVLNNLFYITAKVHCCFVEYLCCSLRNIRTEMLSFL